MKRDQDQYSESQTKQRMDDALRRALNTPHKPHKPLKAKASPRPAKAQKSGGTKA